MGSKDPGKPTRTLARTRLLHCKHTTSLPETDMMATQQSPGGGFTRAAPSEARSRGLGSPGGTGQGRWADPRRAGKLAIKMHKIQSHFLMMRERNTETEMDSCHRI